MKKPAFIFVACFILLLFFCACGTKAGDVTIVADEQEFIPLSNWIFARDKDGIIGDGARKQPEEVADELAAIPVEDTIYVSIEGKTTGQQYYTLFNDKLEELYYRSDSFEVPSGNGEFICIVEVAWGNEEEYEGYQYFFKFTK